MVHLIDVLRRIRNLPESVGDQGGSDREQRHQHCGVPGAQTEEHTQRSEELDAGRKERDRIGADRNAVTGQVSRESVESHQLVETAIEKDRRHQHTTEEQYDIAARDFSLGSCRYVSMPTRFRHHASPYPDRRPTTRRDTNRTQWPLRSARSQSRHERVFGQMVAAGAIRRGTARSRSREERDAVFSAPRNRRRRVRTGNRFAHEQATRGTDTD